MPTAGATLNWKLPPGNQTTKSGTNQSFDADQEPSDLSIASQLNDFVPLSKLMAEQITALRGWAKGRARLATSLVVEKAGRKFA